MDLNDEQERDAESDAREEALQRLRLMNAAIQEGVDRMMEEVWRELDKAEFEDRGDENVLADEDFD